MITDSKYFYLHNMSSQLVYPAYKRNIGQAQDKHLSTCVHGNDWDTTTLKFVTGTHKQVSKYVNPKTKGLHTGRAG
ncbi:TPA: hypothetical protein ACH3X1_006703 [Trebouxia sp. C0004]